MADFHHPKLRLLKGDELTYQELDNNINSFYYSSSLDGSNIKLYAGSTSGSFSGYTQSYDVNAFTASHAVSASYIPTASYALFAISSSVEVTLEHSSSYAESASFADSSNNALSASHFANGVISASVNLNTLTLRKADNSTLSYLIHTGSGEANPDGIISSSAQIKLFTANSILSGSNILSSSAQIALLNAGIVSASAQIKDRLVSATSFGSASNAIIRNTLGTNQFILSGSKPNASTLRLHPAAGTNLDYEVGGEDLRLQAVLDITGSLIKNAALSGSTTNTIRFTKQDDSTIDLTIATSSVSIDGLLSSSAQIAEDISGSGNVRFEALNAETGSINTRLNNAEATGSNVPGLLAITGSLIKNAALSGSTTNTIRFTQQDDSTIDITIATSSVSIDGLVSSSAQIDGAQLGANKNITIAGTSVNLGSSISLSTINAGSSIVSGSGIINAALSGSTTNTIRFTKQDDSTIDITIATSSVSIDGLLSSSAQIAEDISGSGNVRFEALNAATSSYATKLDMNLVSSSVLSNPNYGQGLIRHQVNGGDPADAQVSNLSKTDSPVFDGITISGSTNFGSGSNSNSHLFTGSVYISGALHLGGGSAIGNDITGAYWQGYQISSSKIDLAAGSSLTAAQISGSGNVRFEALNAATSSYLLNTTDTLTGNLTVTGTVTAVSGAFERLDTTIVSSSIIYTSGSNIFGDDQADKHMFTGSVHISQSLDITGSLTLNGVAITTGSNTVLNIIEGGGINVSNSSGIFTVSAEAASATNAGITEYASTSEMTEGTSTTRAVTPANYLSRSTDLDVLNISGILTATSSYYNTSSISEDTLLLITSTTTHSLSGEFTDTNTFRTVKVDTNNDGTANETIGAAEELKLVGGTNVTLAEDAGKVTITAAGTAATNLSKTVSGTGFSVNSSTGDNVALTLADTSNWGLMSDEMFDKLDGIEASANNYSHPNHSGDVTSAGDGATTIANDAVTYAKMQNVSATDRILGRDTAGAGNVEEITPANVRGMINVEDGANNYSHPNHTGDVTSSGDGATTIANDKVTYAKMQNIPTANILGRVTAGTGNVEDLTATQVRTLLNVADGATNVTNNNQITNGAGYTTAAGTVDTSGTPAAQQIAIFTDANTISGSTNLQMHVNGSYPEFGGLQVGSGGTANLYLGNPITPSSADKGARFHSNNNDFYFDFQGDATQNFYFRDYDGSGGIHNRFTFDFINSGFTAATATFSANVTANNFVTTSDRELKDNIVPIKEGLETLKKFVSYEYELEGKKDAGFIAQEVEETLSYAVHKKQDGYLALDTKPILAHMHKAILEIDQRLSAIEDKLK